MNLIFFQGSFSTRAFHSHQRTLGALVKQSRKPMDPFQITNRQCPPLPAYLSAPILSVSDVSRRTSRHVCRRLGVCP